MDLNNRRKIVPIDGFTFFVQEKQDGIFHFVNRIGQCDLLCEQVYVFW